MEMEKKGMMKQTVVLYPGMGLLGHLFPMMELANVFVKHGLDVAVVLLDPPPPFKSAGASPDVERIIAANANPSISFHLLPFPTIPPLTDPAAAAATINPCDPLELMLKIPQQSNGPLESFLRSILSRRRLHSLVIDLLNGDAVDVAVKLGVPVYSFFTSGAAALLFLAHLPALYAGADARTGLKELGDTPLEFPGVPPVPASHLSAEGLEPPGEARHKVAMRLWECYMATRGVLVNTVESLERPAVQVLRDRPSVLGRVLPPVFCVGPLVATSGGRRVGAGGDKVTGRHECLAWLDVQPDRSVVFLCFGSLGVLPEEQLREIAVGLEKSGQRFLWVVRMPAAAGKMDDLESLLPEGFLARTNGWGLVVKSWAPQVDVLRHPAIGAFLTHCGWNSTLESLMAGVPMLCWPLYAEQKMNKVFISTSLDKGGMGVGVELDGYQVGFVKADEVAAKLRLVMESDKGRELRARVSEHKKEAEAALEEGGSSHEAFLHFLLDAQTNIGHASPPSAPPLRLQ